MILSERNSLEKIRRCLNIFYFNFQLINYFKINHPWKRIQSRGNIVYKF